MSLLQRAIGAYLGPRVRRRARGKGFADLSAQLARSRDELLPRVLAARDTAGNREALNHWLGIERWSADRVRRWRDPPPPTESYHAFRLPDGADLAALQEGFAAARAETIALAETLAAEGADPAAVVVHKDAGPFTLVEWLEYVDDHSQRERLRLRPGRPG